MVAVQRADERKESFMSGFREWLVRFETKGASRWIPLAAAGYRLHN
jgi:hypothetical protein